MSEFTLAPITMTSGPGREANLHQAEAFVREAKAKGAEWVMLPEMFSYYGPYENLDSLAEAEDGPLTLQLSALAKSLGIVLFAGTVPEKTDEEHVSASGNKRVHNTLYVFGRDGTILSKYRKTHLFNLSGLGSADYNESEGFVEGNALVSCKIDDLNVGLSICYDLRFSGLYFFHLADEIGRLFYPYGNGDDIPHAM